MEKTGAFTVIHLSVYVITEFSKSQAATYSEACKFGNEIHKGLDFGHRVKIRRHSAVGIEVSKISYSFRNSFFLTDLHIERAVPKRIVHYR